MKIKLFNALVILFIISKSYGQVSSTITFKYEEAETKLLGLKIEEPLFFKSDGSLSFRTKSAIDFTSYAIGWKTNRNDFSPEEFEVFAKVHNKELGWSELHEYHGYTHPDDNIRDLYLTDLLFGLDQWLHDSIEFIISPPDGAVINEVHIVLQDMSSQTVNEIRPKIKDKPSFSKSCPELPPIVPRSDWCGGYADCHNPPNITPYRTPTHVVVHYGGASGEYTDGYAVVRSYWNYHVNTKGWWDIGYNYLFDKFGNLFQGRHNANIPFEDVRGVHAGNAHANDNSIGVCFLRNTDIIGVTTEQMNTAYQFLGWWFNHKGFDPLGYEYIAGNVHPRIIGHKDVSDSPTSCPGVVLSDLMPTMRNSVKEVIDDCDGLSVTTNNITSITYTSAISGGNVIDDGGSTVTARGIVWSDFQNPTIDNNIGITYNGVGTGSFNSNLTELLPGITYFVRAYATNSEGTSYGQQISFTTLDCVFNPGLIKDNQTICEDTSPEIFTGTLASDGTGNFSYQWQIQPNCIGEWSNIHNATHHNYNHGNLTNDACFRRKVTDVCGEKFSLLELENMSDILVWYPINADVLDYSDNNIEAVNNGATFTTNLHGTNNAALHFAGSSNYIELPPTNEIFGVNSGSSVSGVTVAARIFIESGDLNESRRIIATYASSSSTAFGFIINTESKVVAYGPSTGRKIYINGVETDSFSTNQWQHVVVTYPGSSTVTNKRAEIGRWSGDGYPNGVNYMKGKIDDIRFYNRVLSQSEIQDVFDSYSNTYVKVKTEICSELPIVETLAITNITSSTAVSGGNVLSDGGSQVIARGIVWSKQDNPTIENNIDITTDGTGVGNFTSNITNLDSGETYFVRAYATNNSGTSYGQLFNFTAGQEQDYNVHVELSNHYDILTNSIVTIVVSVSGLPVEINPLGVQGSIKFDTELLEYQGHLSYQLDASSLAVSSVSGQSDTRTIFWSTDHGSSTVTNGDLLGLQFIYKGEGEICTDIVWTSDPLLEMLIDDEWNQIEAIWNDGEICGIEEGFVISGKIKYAGSVNASGNQPIYNEPIYNLDSVIVIIETLQGLEVGRDTTDNSGEFYIDNVLDEGDYKIVYYKLNNDYYKWLCSGSGINVADVGMFRTRIVDPYNLRFNFDDLYSNAMDLNDDGYLNTIDVSMLQTKIVNPFNPDFIEMQNFMPHGTWVRGESYLTIDSDINDLEYVLIAYGDYNGSATGYMYSDFSTQTWDAGKSSLKYDNFIIQTDESLIIEGDIFTLPIRVSGDYENNYGFQLELEYPMLMYKLLSANVLIDNTKIKGVINKDLTDALITTNDFLITDIDGIIRILYTSPHGASFNISSKDVLINLEFEKLFTENSLNDFYIEGRRFLLSTIDFELLSSVNLKIPKLKAPTLLITDSELLSLQLYPNPAKDLVFIELDVYKSGMADIILIDLLGRELKKMENKKLFKSINKFQFDISELTSGIYTLRINYNNSEDSKTFNFKLIVD